MIYLGILIGFILGLPIGFIKWKKTTVNKNYLRRGLLVKTYTVGGSDTIDCVFEIGEIESTDTLSKIEVITVKPNRSEYNTDYQKKRLADMIDNSWEISSDIKWIVTSRSDNRNDKINQILS